MSESFSVGEIVWAKVRGYPFWPGIIKGIEECSKEKKYSINFIGDSTHATIPKKCLNKFDKHYSIHSKCKQKKLEEAIKKAMELFEEKNKNKKDFFKNLKKLNENEKKSKKEEKKIDKKDEKTEEKNDNTMEVEDDNKEENKETKDMPKESNKENNNYEINTNTKDNKNTEKNKENVEKNQITKEESAISINPEPINFNKKKPKKIEKFENDLINKIASFLRQITGLVYMKESKKYFEENYEDFEKIFGYLATYKMNEPIEFLKKTSIGKYVKYINENCDDKKIKVMTDDVYKNLEEQLMNYLFAKKH